MNGVPVSAPDRDVLGVILAAGKGTRLHPFSERYPKPALPILGKPLIQYQVESMRALGITRVLIVVGHLGFEIVRCLGDGARFGVQIEYIDQGPTLGLAHALGKLESRVDKPFLLVLGDIFFVHEDLGTMLSQLGRDDVMGVLAVKQELDAEAMRRNFVVMEDATGDVVRVVEKPRYPRTNLKGCGIYAFDPAVFDAVRRTPRTAMRDEYELTDAIQIFIDDGHRVRAARVIREDLNLSFPTDLLEINLKLMPAGGFFGENARVEPGASVTESVLMDGARVCEGASLDACVVFPGVTVRAHARRRIFTHELEIDCR